VIQKPDHTPGLEMPRKSGGLPSSVHRIGPSKDAKAVTVEHTVWRHKNREDPRDAMDRLESIMAY
jgi:hypothetical protein